MPVATLHAVNGHSMTNVPDGMEIALFAMGCFWGVERLFWQLENAVSWRDQVNTYFYRKSGIPDEKGRKIYQ